MVIAKKTYEVASLNIISNINLHSNSAIVSLHLEGSIVWKSNMHTCRSMRSIVIWGSIIMFRISVRQYLFPLIFISIIVTYEAIPSFKDRAILYVLIPNNNKRTVGKASFSRISLVGKTIIVIDVTIFLLVGSKMAAVFNIYIFVVQYHLPIRRYNRGLAMVLEYVCQWRR